MNATLIAVGVLFVALIVAALAWRRRSRASASGAGEVDDELREVFLAEARGEIASLARLLPHWRAAPADLDRVVPLRRTFHTFKGSGHMVGAQQLAELSARIEQVLVRVIERELAPQPDVIDVVARAAAAVPGLIDAYATGRRGGGDVATIIAAAQRLLQRPNAPRKLTEKREVSEQK